MIVLTRCTKSKTHRTNGTGGKAKIYSFYLYVALVLTETNLELLNKFLILADFLMLCIGRVVESSHWHYWGTCRLPLIESLKLHNGEEQIIHNVNGHLSWVLTYNVCAIPTDRLTYYRPLKLTSLLRHPWRSYTQLYYTKKKAIKSNVKKVGCNIYKSFASKYEWIFFCYCYPLFQIITICATP